MKKKEKKIIRQRNIVPIGASLVHGFALVIGLLNALNAAWAGGTVRDGFDYSKTWCAPSERIYFSCQTGRKTVSLCGSDRITKNEGYLQYRFGLLGKDAEMVYPDIRISPRGKFFDYLESSAHSFYYQIGFRRDEFYYWVFVDTASVELAYGYGIFVADIGRKLKKLSCRGGESTYVDTALSRMYYEGVLEHQAGEPAKALYMLQNIK